jgi:hypothetical protein
MTDPLEIVPVPVRIEGHDPRPAVVRLFFRTGSYGGMPGAAIAGVVVLEGDEHVSIGLTRRVVFGEAPDETMYAELLLMGGRASLDVPVTLGQRTLIDASTGAVVPRLEWKDPLGTPIWRWT